MTSESAHPCFAKKTTPETRVIMDPSAVVDATRNAPSIVCPSCGRSGPRPVDHIPLAYEFAGRILEQPLPGGMLYRCLECKLFFRHPRLSKQELDRLYTAGASENWQSAARARTDCVIVAELIRQQHDVKSVLDVGCFDGQFLHYLGAHYVRSGIEIHPRAAEAAARKGITIVGRDFSDLGKLRENYDCVVAIDVIEHVEDPLAFLAGLARVTSAGGMVIISTGNGDARSWRIMRGMYWYCTIPEHISFVSPDWCRRAAASRRLTVAHIEEFSHEPLPAWNAFAHAAANVLYRCAPRSAAGLRRLYAKLRGKSPQAWYELPPPWRCAKDHFVAVFRTSEHPTSEEI